MKKLLPILLLILLAAKGNSQPDINRLEPVCLVRMQYSEGKYTLETDTGSRGTGNNPEEAVTNLRESAGGVVFLDTAEFLLIDENMQVREEIYDLLRPSCRVCAARGNMDLPQATEYLQVHKPRLRLRELRAGVDQIQVLTMNEGGGQLAG